MTQDAVSPTLTAAPVPAAGGCRVSARHHPEPAPMSCARIATFITVNGLLAGLGLFLALDLLPHLRSGAVLAWLGTDTATTAFVRELCFGLVMAWALRPRATAAAED